MQRFTDSRQPKYKLKKLHIGLVSVLFGVYIISINDLTVHADVTVSHTSIDAYGGTTSTIREPKSLQKSNEQVDAVDTNAINKTEVTSSPIQESKSLQKSNEQVDAVDTNAVNKAEVTSSPIQESKSLQKNNEQVDAVDTNAVNKAEVTSSPIQESKSLQKNNEQVDAVDTNAVNKAEVTSSPIQESKSLQKSNGQISIVDDIDIWNLTGIGNYQYGTVKYNTIDRELVISGNGQSPHYYYHNKAYSKINVLRDDFPIYSHEFIGDKGEKFEKKIILQKNDIISIFQDEPGRIKVSTEKLKYTDLSNTKTFTYLVNDNGQLTNVTDYTEIKNSLANIFKTSEQSELKFGISISDISQLRETIENNKYLTSSERVQLLSKVDKAISIINSRPSGLEKNIIKEVNIFSVAPNVETNREGRPMGNNMDRQDLGITMHRGAKFKIKVTGDSNKSNTLYLDLIDSSSRNEQLVNLKVNGDWVEVTANEDNVAYIKTPATGDYKVQYQVVDGRIDELPIFSHSSSINQQFIQNEWDQTKAPYALMKSYNIQLQIPYSDIKNVARTDMLSLLDQYDNQLFKLYADLTGISYNTSDTPRMRRYFAMPDKNGVGAAYYNSGKWIAINGSSVSSYLTIDWLTLHEIAHGYELPSATMDIIDNFNNVYGTIYQSKYTYPDINDFNQKSWIFNGGKDNNVNNVVKNIIDERKTFNQIDLRERLILLLSLASYQSTDSWTVFNNYHREIANKNEEANDLGKDWVLAFQKQYNVDLIPFFNTIGVPIDQIMTNNLANSNSKPLGMLVQLIGKDKIDQVMKKLGWRNQALKTTLSLVTTDDLSILGLKSSVQLIFNNTSIAVGHKFNLKNGDKVVEQIIIPEDATSQYEITLKNLPVGVYTLVSDDTNVVVTNPYVYVSDGKINNINISLSDNILSIVHSLYTDNSYTALKPNTTLRDIMNAENLVAQLKNLNIKSNNQYLVDKARSLLEQVTLLGGNDAVFNTINDNGGNGTLTIQSYRVQPHWAFNSDIYATIKIYNTKEELVYSNDIIADKVQPEETTVLNNTEGYKIIVTHKEGISRLRANLGNEAITPSNKQIFFIQGGKLTPQVPLLKLDVPTKITIKLGQYNDYDDLIREIRPKVFPNDKNVNVLVKNSNINFNMAGSYSLFLEARLNNTSVLSLVEVNLVRDSATAAVVFIDNGINKNDQKKILSTTVLNGYVGDQIDFKSVKDKLLAYENKGYEIVSDGIPVGITNYDNVGDINNPSQHYEVHLVHGITTVTPDDPKSPGMLINPNDSNGLKYTVEQTNVIERHMFTVNYICIEDSKVNNLNSDTQNSVWTRSITIDKVTGKIISSTPWMTTMQKYNIVKTPVRTGYIADRAFVIGKLLQNNYTETVTYKELGKIIPVDTSGTKILGVETPRYNNDPKDPTKCGETPTPKVPGYTTDVLNVIPNNPGEDTKVIYTPIMNNVIEKTSQTVTYKGAGEATPETNVQNDYEFIGKYNEATGETTWDEESHNYGEVKTPVVQGYYADKDSVVGAVVTPNNPTSEETVTYKELGKIIPVDTSGTKILGVETPRYNNDPKDPTKCGETPTPKVPGYTTDVLNVIPNNPGEDTKVIYTPIMNNVIEKTSQTVTYKGAGEATPETNVQNDYEFIGKYNEATGETTWDEESHNYGEVKTPVVQGYYADKDSVVGAVVTPNNPTSEETVTYKELGKIIPVDTSGTKILGVETPRYNNDPKDPTKCGETPTPKVPGYTTDVLNVIPNNPGEDTKVIYTPIMNNVIEKTSQTVTYKGAGEATPETNVQNDYEFIGKYNEATGETTWDEESHNYGEVKTPVVQGYYADKDSVVGAVVTPNNPTSEETVTYKELGKIIPVDTSGTKILGVETPRYNNDPKDPTKCGETPTPKVPGYTTDVLNVIPNNPGEDTKVIYTPIMNNVIEKTSQTVTYKGAGEATPETNVQNDYEFIGKYNEATGETTWDEESHNYGEVKTPVVQGYYADKDSVVGAVVTPNNPTSEETVTYKELGKIIPVDTSGTKILGVETPRYNNDPKDPTKCGETPIPKVPGYTTDVLNIIPNNPGEDTKVIYTPIMNNVTENLTDADKYTPEAKEPNVGLNEKANPDDSIANLKNLPEGTTTEFKDPVDTTIEGTKYATVVVTYPDGSKDEVPVKIVVTDGRTDAEKNEPQGKSVEVELGKTPDAKDGIVNVNDLPEGTDFTWKEPIDTTTPGEKEGKIVVIYPDSLREEIKVVINVVDDRTDADKYELTTKPVEVIEVVVKAKASNGNKQDVAGAKEETVAQPKLTNVSKPTDNKRQQELPQTGEADTQAASVAGVLMTALAGLFGLGAVADKKKRKN